MYRFVSTQKYVYILSEARNALVLLWCMFFFFLSMKKWATRPLAPMFNPPGDCFWSEVYVVGSLGEVRGKKGIFRQQPFLMIMFFVVIMWDKNINIRNSYRICENIIYGCGKMFIIFYVFRVIYRVFRKKCCVPTIYFYNSCECNFLAPWKCSTILYKVRHELFLESKKTKFERYMLQFKFV